MEHSGNGRMKPVVPVAARSRFRAILGGRCPRCYLGRVFRGMFSMNDLCPVCGLRFGREPGYFMGAMYFSYGLGVVVLTSIFLLLWYLVVPEWSFAEVAIPAIVLYLPFVPAIFRYSRVLWMHFDRAIDPDRPGDEA